MKRSLQIAASGAAFAALLATSSQALAGGIFTVVNATSRTIVPYFKSNCWGPGMGNPSPKGYVDFGNIGAGGQFPWDFTDPALIDPNCRHPKVEFTFGYFHGPDFAPVKVPSYQKFTFTPDATRDEVAVVGGAINVAGPKNDRDDD
jgi:hypothetical protein